MMKHYLYIVTFILLILSAERALAQETRFFDELYDVPVMAGLVALPEQAMSYDKPEGRISQSMAYAPNGNWDAITLFYKESLLQMGWKAVAPNKYAREGELLEITHEESAEEGRNASNSGLIIRFLLRPV